MVCLVHFAFTIFSPCTVAREIASLHTFLWTITLLFPSMNPTIASPGIGLQHSATLYVSVWSTVFRSQRPHQRGSDQGSPQRERDRMDKDGAVYRQRTVLGSGVRVRGLR